MRSSRRIFPALTAFAVIAFGVLSVALFGDLGWVLAAGGFGLLAITQPFFSLVIYVPVNFILVTSFSLGGFVLAPETAFLFVIALACCFSAVARSESFSAFFENSKGPLIAWLGFSVATLFSALANSWTPDVSARFAIAPIWLLNVSVPILLMQTQRQAQGICIGLIWGGWILSIGLLAFPDKLSEVDLLISQFSNPTGHFLSLGLVLSLILAIGERGLKRAGLVALAAVIFPALYSVGSRAAFLAAAGGLLVPSFLYWWPRFRLVSPVRRLFFVSVVVLAVSVLFLRGNLSGEQGSGWDNFFQPSGSSNLYRLEILIASLRVGLESFWFGAGPGNLGEAILGHTDGLSSLGGFIVVADNDYARIFGELGIFGLVAMVFPGMFLINQLRHGFRERQISVVPLSLAAGQLGWLYTVAFFEGVFISAIGWLLLGIAWATQKVARKQ